MEYEIESLIEDLALPRQVIQEDVEKGRLKVYQHNDDDKYYVDAEIFLDYIAVRVVELQKDHQRAFWLAMKKMVMSPKHPGQLSPEEIAVVMTAIEQQIRKL